MIENEKVFNGIVPVKHLMIPSKTHSNHLVVVFSGFPSQGNPPAYNYIRSLDDIDTNKLYILDDYNHTHPSGATYYLGSKRDNSVEMSVVSLITKVANELGINHKNIITVGSSKGGFASLYFGLKYSFGYAISGAPQTRLGSYLIWNGSQATYVGAFIAGGTDEDSKSYLNNLLFDVAASSTNHPSIYLHVGEGDHHYKGHVTPFTDHLEDIGIPFQIDVADYKEHSQVGEYFPPYLSSVLIDIISK